MKILAAAVVAWALTGCVVVVENHYPEVEKQPEVLTSIDNTDDYTLDDVVTLTLPNDLR